MAQAKIGDRIRLVDMPDDPCPIEKGATGTVTNIFTYGKATLVHGHPYSQVSVKWDNGRTLALVVPPDVFEIIPGE